MDYFTVAQAANITSFLATALLLGLLIRQSLKQSWKRYLLIGISGQLLWSGSTVTSYYTLTAPQIHLFIEIVRLSAWIIALTLMLNRRMPVKRWPYSTHLIILIATALSLFGFTAVIYPDSSATVIRLAFIFLAAICLVLAEQVIRNLNAHRMLKLLGLCLAFLFTYDVLAFSLEFSAESSSSLFIQGRAALAFAVAVALGIGSIVFNDSDDGQYLFSVSRPAAFFSTAVIFLFILISSLFVGSFFVSTSGFLISYLFVLLLVIVTIVFSGLIVSRTFRQHFEVFINKHFYTLKYDYREEWLSAIRKISDLSADQPDYYEQILCILKDGLRSPSGMLWLRQGSELTQVTGDLHLEGAPDAVMINEPFVRKMVKASWIFVPHSRNRSLTENNDLLPDWIRTNPDVWLMSPLMIQMKLVGFVVLKRPRVKTEITFEDRDLMTNLSTQTASHLLLQQQEKVISDAKQLETYNRMSAFIMHDINNVIAQLGLIGKNAQRHRNNPAFIDDMIKTVHNATTRMQSLIQKFNPATEETRVRFQASELGRSLSQALEGTQPVLEVDVQEDFFIEADKNKLELALKNLIRNAQEATDVNGRIELQISRSESRGKISITDNGSGMTAQFINEELFRPFSSTKLNNGLGIGAYLTKSYLEQLGAILRVDSKIGQGTRFDILFP